MRPQVPDVTTGRSFVRFAAGRVINVLGLFFDMLSMVVFTTRHVRKLPVTWGLAVVFTGLQLADQD